MNIFEAGETLSMRTAVALGNFDGVHRGHAALLSKAVEEGKKRGLFSLAYTFDLHPQNVMAGSTVTPLLTSREEKTEMLQSLGLDGVYFEHFTEEFSLLSPEEFVQNILVDQLKADLCICGFHYHFGARGEGDVHLLREICKEKGIDLLILPPVTVGGVTVASSLIRSLVSSGKMEKAAELLGRPFSLSAIVEEGKQLGRTLGLPTINQRFSEGGVIPRFGVYESCTFVDGTAYQSITNVGMRPTVSGETLNAETHIVGFSGDLYGQKVQVDFFRFLRPERKFEHVKALKKQIEEDLLHLSK